MVINLGRPIDVGTKRIVVAYAHPCAESLAAAVLEQTRRGLDRAGHEVEVIDLYASDYELGGPLPARQSAALQRADALVLVHPTWWSGHPALLLGWLDAVARAGTYPWQRIVVVTTHGGRRTANRVAGESGRRVVRRAFRRRCAPLAVVRWCALYGLDRDRETDRVRFLARVEREIAALVG